MGQFLDSIKHGKTQSGKEQPISMDDYAVNTTMESGGVVMTNSDGVTCYLYDKDLQKTGKREEMAFAWMNNLYNHSCNVLRYEIKSRSLLCGSHVNVKAVLEYGEKNLFQIINEQQDAVETYETQQSGVKFDTPLELLNFIKLMIDVVQEQQQKNKVWVAFHTKNILHFSKSKSFKYFYLFNFDDTNINEEFFAPDTIAGMEPDERGTVFSMGMVLLSLFLKEDCSDCYNYQNHTFCESIFQDKIQRLKEKMITKGLLGILDDQSQYVTQFDEEVSEFILLMTDKGPEQLAFAQVKKRYLWLIKKASVSFGVSNQQNSRSILQPISSKRFHKRMPRTNTKRNIANFSSQEEIHFKTTFTEIDDSDIFTISKSNAQPQLKGKSKESHTLKWKKAITRKMKEQKENMPYYQQQ